MTPVSTCEKCEKEYGVHARVAGGRHAWLCTACAAAWRRHVRTLPSWQEYLKCLAQERHLNARAQGTTPPTYLEWEALEIRHDDSQWTLFELADKWLGEKIGKAGDTESDDGASSDGERTDAARSIPRLGNAGGYAGI